MGFILCLWLFMGLICALIAASKGRSGFGWFILGCLFGPLAVLCAAVMSRDAPQAQPVLAQPMKTCPFCAEAVQPAAVLCKHCQQPLTPEALPQATAAAANPWSQDAR